MKATVSFEWRNIEEPTFEPEEIIRKALYDAGYSVGHIFVQPTRTAEFIVLDFIVQPTGATFPE